MEVHGQNNKIEYNTTVFVHPGTDMLEMKEWKDNLIAILQQVPSEANALKPLIQFIVTVLAPAKIFMLKSSKVEAIDSDTYVHLLIVLPECQDASFPELEPVFKIANLKHPKISCSLHDVGRVKECMERGTIFYSMNCIEKNLVYDDKRYSLPVATSEALRNMKLQSKEAFALCFRKAVSFYQSAVFVYEINPEPMVVFYLHQSIELTYRAILKSLNGYYKKTHVIRTLKDLAHYCAPQLNAIFPDNTEQEKHLLNVLENGYLNARYDNQYTIVPADLLILLERAKRIMDVAQDMIEQTITSLAQDA